MIFEEDKNGSMSCNHPMTDDEMDLWTLLCEGVKEQKEKWQR